VYIFDRAPDDSWSQSAYVKGTISNNGAWFGVSVDLRGDVLAVGALAEVSIDGEPGAAYVFRRVRPSALPVGPDCRPPGQQLVG
jgi:hypothetical protein